MMETLYDEMLEILRVSYVDGFVFVLENFCDVVFVGLVMY